MVAIRSSPKCKFQPWFHSYQPSVHHTNKISPTEAANKVKPVMISTEGMTAFRDPRLVTMIIVTD